MLPNRSVPTLDGYGHISTGIVINPVNKCLAFIVLDRKNKLTLANLLKFL